MQIDNASANALKIIGANGQISLGKEFAGTQVIVEREQGAWVIREAVVIPVNELDLHAADAAAGLQAAMRAAVKTERKATTAAQLAALKKELLNGGQES